MTALCYHFACKDKAFLLNYQIYVFFLLLGAALWRRNAYRLVLIVDVWALVENQKCCYSTVHQWCLSVALPYWISCKALYNCRLIVPGVVPNS